MRNIKELVLSIKSKYQTNNPFDILRSEGIELMRTEIHKSTKGFFFLNEVEDGIIILNDMYCEREQLITAAHELGHGLLHGNSEVLYLRNNTISMPSKYELEANIFAAELLIDDNIFDEYKGYSMSHIAAIAGVPEEFVNLKYRGLFL